MDLARLKDPFPSSDIEWRIGRAGKNDKGVWAMCLAYITNRAIMERLDEVVGPENWKNEYDKAPNGGVLCGLSVRVGDEWVTKWDGADNTDMEAVKGGLSGAMKRAGVQWGIGRYLYDLPEGWAIVSSGGANFGKTKDGESFRWDPPGLPDWALPGGSGKPDGAHPPVRTPERAPQAAKPQQKASAPAGDACPKCGGGVYDDRLGKRNPKAPDWKCRDKEGCGWVLWVESARRELERALDHLRATGLITPGQMQHIMTGTAEGDLAALAAAQRWVNEKTEEVTGS